MSVRKFSSMNLWDSLTQSKKFELDVLWDKVTLTYQHPLEVNSTLALKSTHGDVNDVALELSEIKTDHQDFKTLYDSVVPPNSSDIDVLQIQQHDANTNTNLAIMRDRLSKLENALRGLVGSYQYDLVDPNNTNEGPFFYVNGINTFTGKPEYRWPLYFGTSNVQAVAQQNNWSNTSSTSVTVSGTTFYSPSFLGPNIHVTPPPLSHGVVYTEIVPPPAINLQSTYSFKTGDPVDIAVEAPSTVYKYWSTSVGGYGSTSLISGNYSQATGRLTGTMGSENFTLTVTRSVVFQGLVTLVQAKTISVTVA